MISCQNNLLPILIMLNQNQPTWPYLYVFYNVHYVYAYGKNYKLVMVAYDKNYKEPNFR